MPPIPPDIQLFGSGLGQYGSGSNRGTPPAAATGRDTKAGAARIAMSATKATPANIPVFIFYLLGALGLSPPVLLEPTKSFLPSGKVMSFPFALLVPSLA